MYAALRGRADGLIAQGDARGRGQLMADTLVERVTGQASAESVPVEIELIMTDAALLAGSDPTGRRPAGGDEPAVLLGCGPVPAAWARDLVLGAGQADAPRWLRRLYRHPTTGELTSMDSHRRLFTAAQRRFVRLRDQDGCRTPWCDAPIRHVDHVTSVAAGGRTAVANAQGLCAACNYAQQAPGWQARPARPGEPPGQITLTTPTGHTYAHQPADPPGASPPPAAWPAVA